MHLRKLIWVCGFACALLANVVAALGLGEVRLNSTLNEPLNAEVKLLDTRGLSASQIIVTLASPADFERNGVDRPYFLTEFEFEILLNHPGGAIARVTSRSPVREPFLNFLVEARWPTGRLLREYTLLMDLPTFSDSAPAAVARAPATSSTSSATPQAQSRTATPSRSAPTGSARAASGLSGDSYTVGTNDTLWEIALDVRPDSSHSVHQTMLAIQRLNPDAFIDGNINLLRNGQVLRIPSSDDIQAVTRNEAVAEVGRQNQVWSDDSMGAQLSATRRDTSTRRSADTVSGSVRLATPGRDDSATGQGSGENTGSGRALEAELAATLEELDKTKGENQELSSRVRDLEDQIETMERLVEVSNEQLRALQLSASQNDAATTDDAESEYAQSEYTSPYEADSVSAEDSTTEVPESDLSEETVTTADEPVAAEEAPVVSEPVAPIDSRRVVTPPQPSKTIVDHIMENLLWIILAIVVLVSVVGAVIYRRRAQAETEALPEDDFFSMDAEDDEEFDSAAPDQEDDVDADEVPLFDEEDIPAEAETGDVVGEADIYIAYGKFDQAEEMLLAGLAKDPDSVDIRLKLLEVYSQTQDAEKFDHYYAGLIGFAGQPALARAAELREHIVGAGEFTPTDTSDAFDADDLDISSADAIDLDESSEAEDGVAIEDDLDFSFDVDEDSLPLPEEDESPQANDLSAVNSRYDLSFDEPVSTSSSTASSEKDEFSFDFDLEDAPESETVSSTPAETDEDELTFELDDVDPEPESKVSLDVSDDADDLNFELDEPVDIPAQVVAVPAPASDKALNEAEEELQLPDDNSDDFNLDMEMGDLDLAALDEEMSDLDADFAVVEQSEELDVSLGDDADALVEEDKFELELNDDGIDAEDELSFDHPDIQPSEEQSALVLQPVVSDTPDVADTPEDDDVFDQALSEFTTDESDNAAIPELDDLSDEDMDAELDFLADADEAATKLDLARAYIDMGDSDGARDILAEVAHEGNEQQRQEAVDLLSRIDA